MRLSNPLFYFLITIIQTAFSKVPDLSDSALDSASDGEGPFIVRGKLHFDPPLPVGADLARPWQISISLEDVSLADAPATMIHRVLTTSFSDNSVPSTYEFPATKLEHSRQRLAVSVVLNLGWIPGSGSQEWLRSGDYLTTESHTPDWGKVDPNDMSVTEDITVRQYVSPEEQESISSELTGELNKTAKHDEGRGSVGPHFDRYVA